MSTSRQMTRLYDEILFTRQLLGHGLTYLRKSSFINKGIYFNSFNSLCLGLERLCKICLILDYVRENGKYPEHDYIRKFGHDLEKLILKVESISVDRCEFTELHMMIISHLSNFSNSKGRYSNINFITEGETIDPINEWHDIDKYIVDNLFTDSDKKKFKKLVTYYQSIDKCIPTIVCGHESDSRENIASSDEFFQQYARFEVVSGYRVLFIIQIIEKLFHILLNVNDRLSRDFYVSELGRVFAVFFYGTDSEKRKRMNFIRDS